MKEKLTKLMMAAMTLVTVLGLATTIMTASTPTISAAIDSWSRMDLPSTLNYQMLPDSDIWDLTAGDDGTLFALVEDTTTKTGDAAHRDVMMGGAMRWDGLRWAVYPAYSDISVFKSTDGGYNWTLMWHVPSSETGAPIAVVPQPGYNDDIGSKDAVFLAMGSVFVGTASQVIDNYAGGLSQGNIYRSMDGGASFSRVNPRCPAVTLAPHGPNTGGTITSMDVVENMNPRNTYMAIVGVSSITESDGDGTGSCGEGVYTWNQNNTAVWLDLQISNAMPGFGTPPAPGTMPAGNGLDVIQVMGSRNFTSDGLIAAVANDFLDTDPAHLSNPAVDQGIYVCFYDANDGIWGGDIDSPTNANTASWLTPDYAGAASMDTGADFNNITDCYVFVGLAGCTLFNNDVWRIQGLATVTGPSTVTSCNVAFSGFRISDIMIPEDANTAVYVGCEAPAGQAQVLCLVNGLTWPGPVPSLKPASGAWPVFVTNMAGTVMAAGGGDGATRSGVHKMMRTARGTVFNGVGLMDDIAVSEDIPGYAGHYPGGTTWCLVEAVAEEVSPLYATDGLIYVSTYSEWDNNNTGDEAGLSLWRLTDGKWERVMYENIKLPDGSTFSGKEIKTNIGQYLFVDDMTWWPRVVPQFSTDGSIFLMGARASSGKSYAEMIWYSPDKGNDWRPLPQMPIGAASPTLPGLGLSESGWCVVNSSTLFVGDINGWIYKTTNRGASWTDGALTGQGLEITIIVASPVYNESGAAGKDKCLLVGTYDRAGTGECEVWLSQDGAIKDLENIADEIYVSPSWSGIADADLGGTVVNFDKNWATNKIVYAASAGWLDMWQLTGLGEDNMKRINYTDVSIVRTVIDLADPSASTWENMWDADNWNSAAPRPQPISISGIGGGMPVYRMVMPTALQIGPDGTVYVAFFLWDSSYNHDWVLDAGDNPTPNQPHYGRFTLGGILRSLDGTLAAPEFELLNDGLGSWEGLYLGRVVPGTNLAISLAWDWKEWRFKLATYEDTLSGAGPAPASPLAGASGVGVLVTNTSVNVPLSWQSNGNSSLYQWQVSEDSAFTAPKTGTTSDLTVTVMGLKPGTTYFWHSRSIGPMTSRWNSAQQFTTVIGGYSGAPKLNTPEIGSTISDETPLFTWSGIASATNYQIQVATSPAFAVADIVIDEELGNVQAFEADELANGTYYWQIKGSNATTDTETPWSALGSFTLDTTGAGTPAWVWMLIVMGIILVIVVAVLILNTRRPVKELPAKPDNQTTESPTQ
jgi:hypothetical protein